MTTLADIARNAAASAVGALVDGGTVEYQTAGAVEVATLTLANPAFGAAAAGVITANAVTPDASATGNVSPITQAVFKTSGGAIAWTVPIVEGTPSAGQIGLSSTTLNVGDEAKLTSYTHTQPAT